MAALVIETSNPKTLKLIAEVAKQLGAVVTAKAKEKSHYDPKFVTKVLKSSKSEKLHVISTDTLWESIS